MGSSLNMIDATIDTLRAAGKRRLELAREGLGNTEVRERWGRPADLYPFTPGTCWTPHIRYTVDDYESEIGFFVDLLGFEVVAFDDSCAMFRDPEGVFHLQVSPTLESDATPPDTISLEFMVGNPVASAKALRSRGVVFEKDLAPCVEGSDLYYGRFRTPHGVAVEFWGMRDEKEEAG